MQNQPVKDPAKKEKDLTVVKTFWNEQWQKVDFGGLTKNCDHFISNFGEIKSVDNPCKQSETEGYITKRDLEDLTKYAQSVIRKDSNKSAEMAKDFVQEALLKILTTKAEVPKKKNEHINYCKKVIYNTIMDYYRKKKKKRQAIDLLRERLEKVPEATGDWTVFDIADGYTELIVRRGILTDKELLLWEAIVSLEPVHNIAERFGMKTKSVKPRLYYILNKVKEHIRRREVLHYLADKYPAK